LVVAERVVTRLANLAVPEEALTSKLEVAFEFESYITALTDGEPVAVFPHASRTRTVGAGLNNSPAVTELGTATAAEVETKRADPPVTARELVRLIFVPTKVKTIG
jgi:hypothetical protein